MEDVCLTPCTGIYITVLICCSEIQVWDVHWGTIMMKCPVVRDILLLFRGICARSLTLLRLTVINILNYIVRCIIFMRMICRYTVSQNSNIPGYRSRDIPICIETQCIILCGVHLNSAQYQPFLLDLYWKPMYFETQWLKMVSSLDTGYGSIKKSFTYV